MGCDGMPELVQLIFLIVGQAFLVGEFLGPRPKLVDALVKRSLVAFLAHDGLRPAPCG